jgi:hypothetical protein
MAEKYTCNMPHHTNTGCCNGNCKGPAHHTRRQFITKAEKIEQLNAYAEQLRKELEGVTEKIKELQA